MPDDVLLVGSHEYDTTRALFRRDVAVDGFDRTEMIAGRTLVDVFRGLVVDQAYDVSELGLTYFLRSMDLKHTSTADQFLGIPAFPNRLFRHSSVFVHRGSGITRPQDLVDKVIGEFGMYGQDSGVWSKGILMDEFGFRPERNRWLVGPLESRPLDFSWIPQPRPSGLDVSQVSDGRGLGAMLAAGEIDALFTANVPQAFLDGSPDIVRLFPDYVDVERDYFRRTGVFPMMHTVVIRRSRYEQEPELARRVYDAFLESKNRAADAYRSDRRLYEVTRMLPWTNDLDERNRHLFPEDWWPYGIAANREALDTYLRYHHEQGLSERRWTVEEIFVPELLKT